MKPSTRHPPGDRSVRARIRPDKESGITFGQQHVGRPLLTPDEVRTLSPDRQLLFLAGQRPVIANKLRYYADREFAGRYDPA
jgi:type IV secretion system protein VirD4